MTPTEENSHCCFYEKSDTQNRSEEFLYRAALLGTQFQECKTNQMRMCVCACTCMHTPQLRTLDANIVQLLSDSLPTEVVQNKDLSSSESGLPWPSRV